MCYFNSFSPEIDCTSRQKSVNQQLHPLLPEYVSVATCRQTSFPLRFGQAYNVHCIRTSTTLHVLNGAVCSGRAKTLLTVANDLISRQWNTGVPSALRSPCVVTVAMELWHDHIFQKRTSPWDRRFCWEVCRRLLLRISFLLTLSVKKRSNTGGTN